MVRAVLEVNGRHQTPISQTMAFTADSKRVSIFATGFLITSAATTPAAVKLNADPDPVQAGRGHKSADRLHWGPRLDDLDGVRRLGQLPAPSHP